MSTVLVSTDKDRQDQGLQKKKIEIENHHSEKFTNC